MHIAHSSFLRGPTAWIPHFVKIFPSTSLHVWCLHHGTLVHCCSKSYVTVPRKLFICVSAEMGMSVLSHCCGENLNLIIHILFGCSLLTFWGANLLLLCLVLSMILYLGTLLCQPFWVPRRYNRHLFISCLGNSLPFWRRLDLSFSCHGRLS